MLVTGNNYFRQQEVKEILLEDEAIIGQ